MVRNKLAYQLVPGFCAERELNVWAWEHLGHFALRSTILPSLGALIVPLSRAESLRVPPSPVGPTDKGLSLSTASLYTCIPCAARRCRYSRCFLQGVSKPTEEKVVKIFDEAEKRCGKHRPSLTDYFLSS